MTDISDAEIGKLIREKKDLEKKVNERQRLLVNHGSLLERVGRMLQSRPEMMVFEHRSIPMEFAGRPGAPEAPLNTASLITGDKLVEEIEAVRADLTALRQLTEKLRNYGY